MFQWLKKNYRLILVLSSTLFLSYLLSQRGKSPEQFIVDFFNELYKNLTFVLSIFCFCVGLVFWYSLQNFLAISLANSALNSFEAVLLVLLSYWPLISTMLAIVRVLQFSNSWLAMILYSIMATGVITAIALIVFLHKSNSELTGIICEPSQDCLAWLNKLETPFLKFTWLEKLNLSLFTFLSWSSLSFLVYRARLQKKSTLALMLVTLKNFFLLFGLFFLTHYYHLEEKIIGLPIGQTKTAFGMLLRGLIISIFPELFFAIVWCAYQLSHYVQVTTND